MKHNVVNMDSMEALQEFGDRLEKMIKPIEDEVHSQIHLYGEALAAITTGHARNPLFMMFHKEVTLFGKDCLLLGYYLAKKPHELEAQLNEMRATYGSKEIEID